jgi:hypothetical protein
MRAFRSPKGKKLMLPDKNNETELNDIEGNAILCNEMVSSAQN